MSSDLRRAAEEHFNRGNALDERGDRERAMAEWQEAIHLDPDLASAHYNLGIAYADQQNYDSAVTELREAARLEPFELDSRRALAEIYLEQDEAEAAINQLRQILNLSPGDGEAARLLAAAFLDHSKWDEAAGALESGAMAEDDADLWCELGEAYSSEGRWDDAILAFRRTLVCQPGHSKAESALRRLRVPFEEPPETDE